ncbi:hypothetical protein GOP47_0015747 [Adiantum capillus-veneris]|uniref:Cyclin-like domain-containing protein n=1 Tax=Adiantum capillus-veneris TaxID=13818 RepID=A0A9D4ZE94_ADICA|nr:hypothetical protein GOP47_0015747 [Adiantum capillus-veneris]
MELEITTHTPDRVKKLSEKQTPIEGDVLKLKFIKVPTLTPESIESDPLPLPKPIAEFCAVTTGLLREQKSRAHACLCVAEEEVCQIESLQVEEYPFGSGWFFPREQIEQRSLSRRDGISLAKENQLRKSYCVFLQDLGMRLKVPQLTIATSIVFCHRFYLRQSHAKNDRYTIATACMFLAGKVEETPKLLQNVLSLSYDIRHKRDKVAAERIKQKEVYEHEKEQVLLAENVVLQTLGFELNVIHPYKRLVAAVKKLKVTEKSLAQVAWNFLNDALRTSLCLQYEAHYIAAGGIFLAAKFLKMKLPTDCEKPWWQELEVTARQLEDVSNQMLELYEHHRDSTPSPSGITGSVVPPQAPPATPQVTVKRNTKLREKEADCDCSSIQGNVSSIHASKSPYISPEKENFEKPELSDLGSLDVAEESKRIHPRCGSQDCHERESKRPCSGLVT